MLSIIYNPPVYSFVDGWKTPWYRIERERERHTETQHIYEYTTTHHTHRRASSTYMVNVCKTPLKRRIYFYIALCSLVCVCVCVCIHTLFKYIPTEQRTRVWHDAYCMARIVCVYYFYYYYPETALFCIRSKPNKYICYYYIETLGRTKRTKETVCAWCW